MIKAAKELAAACVDVAKNYKTLYVNGCWGAPMTEKNKQRWLKNSYNSRPDRAEKINAASSDTFGFDCVCLIKGMLWGWNGDASKNYGGASYGSNGVADMTLEKMLSVCEDVSEDFGIIHVGEYLYMEGHCGIYIGDGLAVECTPAWENGVQITAVHNIGTKPGYNGRTWIRHGKLPWVAYAAPEQTLKECEFEMVMRVIDGKSKGDDVRAMQILLEANGCRGKMNPALYGSSGSKTVAAIEMFQRKVGLNPDGICGKATWEKLLGV